MVILLLLPLQTSARPMVADLAMRAIDIDTSFTGMDILLFGARNDAGDIVVVVRGPEKDYKVMKKERIGGVWVNSQSEEFKNVYSFYSVASSKPLSNIKNEHLLSSIGIGLDKRNWLAEKKDRLEVGDEFSDALLKEKQRRNLYPKEPQEVTFWGETLFRTTLQFPENISGGTYIAEIYLINGNQVTSMQTTPIYVKKIGFEAFLHDLAYEWPFVYGVLCMFIAMLAGWAVSMIFQRS